jgi:hypothetical protein
VIEHQKTAHITTRSKAETFCQTFADKCRLQAAHDPAPNVTPTTTESINKVIFKLKHVKKLLQQLQPDKATGPDHIPTRVL